MTKPTASEPTAVETDRGESIPLLLEGGEDSVVRPSRLPAERTALPDTPLRKSPDPLSCPLNFVWRGARYHYPPPSPKPLPVAAGRDSPLGTGHQRAAVNTLWSRGRNRWRCR